ncbi:MAG: glycosyltransferase family 4 protein, partial [Acidobacteriota bacterium]
LPAPYFLPIFRQLSVVSGWELVICFSTSWRPDLGWADGSLATELPHGATFLDQEGPDWLRGWGGSLSRSLTLLSLLRREQPDYVISYGYTLLPQLTLLLWAILTRTPFAIIGDANIHCDRARGMKRRLKEVWLRMVTGQAAAILTIGIANRQFWRKYGAREEQMFPVPFAVDNDAFMNGAAARQEATRRERERRGLAERVVFISVGRLIERKNVDLLIRAIQRLEPAAPAALVIAGNGEERTRLEALAAGDQRIHFLGGVAPTDLPSCYGLADVLILAARDEPWGLVTNEAMACGLAIIGHQDCGSTIDLVDEDNGTILRSFEVDELAEAMRWMINDPAAMERMKRNSQEKIGQWSVEAAVSGLINAVENSRRRPGRRYGGRRNNR